MNKAIIKRNAFFLLISTGITLLFSIPVSTQKKDVLAEDVCRKLPYEVSYRRKMDKYTLQDILDKKIDYSEINNPDLTLEESAIEDYCFDVFDKVKNKNFIRDLVFNVLQLWVLMSVVSAYVLKYSKEGFLK